MDRHEYTKLIDDMEAGGATVSLEEWARMEAFDRNAFWRISCGHHQNLLDKALERIEELEGLE